nr:MAG TPA: hypothetical protein [Caudoviricetes sp.]
MVLNLRLSVKTLHIVLLFHLCILRSSYFTYYLS